jgi:hypothetical protein
MPYVYFIHEKDSDGHFKIGKTENHPYERLKQLQTGNWRQLCIYRWLYVDDHTTVENHLHMMFEHSRVRNEWFAISRSVIDEECESVVASIPNSSVSKPYEKYDWTDAAAVKLSLGKKVNTPWKPFNGPGHKLGNHPQEYFGDEI